MQHLNMRSDVPWVDVDYSSLVNLASNFVVATVCVCRMWAWIQTG